MRTVSCVQFGVLGPVTVSTADGPVALAAAKERALLAILLASAGRAMSADRLIDELWGDEPPRTANKTLQTYVSHLRRFLSHRLTTEPAGYSLQVEEHELDALVFERRIRDGRLAFQRGEYVLAARLLADGLTLWRGDAYAGVPPHGVVRSDSIRLDELRQSALEDLAECRLASGEHGTVIAELEALVERHPLRERLWGLLMTALARNGRQGDALRAFQRARSYLVSELGLEPGPELREIERSVLRQEPAALVSPPHPNTLYVANKDGLQIAYWSTGTGRSDIVFCAEIFHNLELVRDIDEIWAFLEPLARAGRLIAVQRRGTGLSDRDANTDLAAPEACVTDIDAVLDAVGCDRASLVGWGHGGQIAIAYAASRPSRVTRVAVVNSYARLAHAPDYPGGIPIEFLETLTEVVENVWGTYRPLHPIFDPEIAEKPDVIARVARYERLTATPREAARLRRALDDVDIRPLLDAVECPVLVAHLRGSITGAENARFLAERLPRARYVEANGSFVPTVADATAVARIVADFLEEPSSTLD